VPEDYYNYLCKADEPEPERRKHLFDAYPEQSMRAARTALLAELGVNDPQTIRERIKNTLEGYKDFVLLGGPPCQAYSVMGRFCIRTMTEGLALPEAVECRMSGELVC
jgi:DNA (cytosine-5)-methyltransferase 1